MLSEKDVSGHYNLKDYISEQCKSLQKVALCQLTVDLGRVMCEFMPVMGCLQVHFWTVI